MFRVPSVSTRARSAFACARFAFSCSFVLGGCATTAGSARYESLSADVGHSLAPSAPARAELARATQLDRAAFVRAVLASNPSIESARQSWRAALARVRQSGSFDDPMVELELAPLSIASSKAPLGYQAMVSQRLPWFGKRSLDAAVAAAEAEAVKSDFEGARRELGMTALMLYDQYFVAQRSLDINAEHVLLMLAMRDAATAQFASGRGSAQDALQAEAELAHMEHDAVVLASQREIVVAQMNELLHRAPEQPLPPPPDSLPAPAPVAAAETQLQVEAVTHRQDIVAARQRARAAQARADRAERDGYPDLTVSTSYNSMWDMPEHRWMLGLGLNLPIFTGKRAGMADEARAMRAQFESDAARMSDAARTQVFVTLKQLKESEHVLRLFETRLLPVARERIDAARAGFITAQNPFMAVIEAERSLRSVELEYQLARAEYAGRRAELDRALGKIPGLDGQEVDR
jgi:outer membrane protein, heavy metal efflux system